MRNTSLQLTNNKQVINSCIQERILMYLFYFKCVNESIVDFLKKQQFRKSVDQKKIDNIFKLKEVIYNFKKLLSLYCEDQDILDAKVQETERYQELIDVIGQVSELVEYF